MGQLSYSWTCAHLTLFLSLGIPSSPILPVENLDLKSQVALHLLQKLFDVISPFYVLNDVFSYIFP